MAKAIVFPFDVAFREGYHSTPMISYLEDITQTYKKGAPLVVTAAGYLGMATAANPYNGTGMVGVAVSDASNLAAAGGPDLVTGEKVHQAYPVGSPSLEFEGQLDASVTTLAQGTHALAQADLWALYGIVQDATSGFWYVNFSDTTDVRVVVTRLLDPIGTLAGRVAFTWIVGTGKTIY